MKLSEHLFQEAASGIRAHAEVTGAMQVAQGLAHSGKNVPRGTPISHDETKRLAGAVASMEHAVATIQGTSVPTENELRDILTKVNVAKSLVELVLDCRFYKDAK